MFAFRSQQIGAPSHFPVTQGPIAHGLSCACTSTSRTGGVSSGSLRNIQTPSLGESAAGFKSRWGVLTTVIMPLRTASKESNYDAGAIPYKVDSRRLGSRSISMWRPCHRQRPSCNSGVKSRIITLIGRRCTRICGRYGGGGE